MNFPRFALTTFGVAFSFGIGLAQGHAGQLLAQYAFDEDSGAEITDTSGYGTAANGTLQGNAGRIASTLHGNGGALDLSHGERSDYVDAGLVEKLGGLEQFTIALWINLQGNPDKLDRILSTAHEKTFEGFDFHIVKPINGELLASNFALGLAVNGNTGSSVALESESINADKQWAFIAVTYDGTQTSENVLFYAGSLSRPAALLDSKAQKIGSGQVSDNTGPLQIGATSATNNDRTPPALMEDVEIYEGVLSRAEIDAIRRRSLR